MMFAAALDPATALASELFEISMIASIAGRSATAR
jgi:hypothetical protein